MKQALHLPLDLDLREPVRRLGHRLGNTEQAIFVVFRLWQDWGRCGVEFRALKHSPTGALEAHCWDREDLAFVIEGYCGWKGKLGDLLLACVASEVLYLECRNGVHGFTLRDFWGYNEHLSPGHKTIQQLGGLARQGKRQLAEIEKASGDQIRILDAQGVLPLEFRAATADERKRAVGLLMRLDRACGLPVRRTTEYTEAILCRALEVIRQHTPDEIGKVESWLIAGRAISDVSKVPDRILADFTQCLAKAG